MRGLEQIPWCYDASMNVMEAFGLSRWREWLVRGAAGKVLEVGCGTGRNLPLYGEEVQVVALEPYVGVLRRTLRRAGSVPLLVGSAEALPFSTETFDTVISGLVFCSVPDPDLGLREVHRVLKPEGQLRMLEHVRATGPRRARFQDWIQPFWTWLSGGCHPNRDTEANVEAAGFEIEAEGRRAQGTMRRFAARPVPSSGTGGDASK